MVDTPPVPPRPEAGRRRRGWLLLVAVVSVAVVLVITGLALLAQSKDSVAVSTIELFSTSHVCGVYGESLQGFTANPGDTVRESFELYNNLTANCTIHSVAVTPSSFSVVGAGLPLTIGARSLGELSFVIQTPSSSYSGTLTVDLE